MRSHLGERRRVGAKTKPSLRTSSSAKASCWFLLLLLVFLVFVVLILILTRWWFSPLQTMRSLAGVAMAKWSMLAGG